MRRILSVIVAGAALLWLVDVSSAQMGGGMGGGVMGGGHMGSGMMGGNTGQGAAPEITVGQAQKAATEYATQYLPGFTVQRTIPLTGMHMTMYQAELSGPGGETRILHVNPWGNVMPFAGATTR